MHRTQCPLRTKCPSFELSAIERFFPRVCGSHSSPAAHAAHLEAPYLRVPLTLSCTQATGNRIHANQGRDPLLVEASKRGLSVSAGQPIFHAALIFVSRTESARSSDADIGAHRPCPLYPTDATEQ